MSVHLNRLGTYDVRYRDAAGKQRSKTFRRKRDAERFDQQTKDARQTGMLAHLDGGTETLDHYVEHTWTPAHAAALAPKTRTVYAQVYDKHLSPRVGAVPLRELTAEAIAHLQAELVADVGPQARKKAMTLLGGILQRAAEAHRIPYNPARLVRKAPVPLPPEVRPLAPVSVEALRAAMLTDKHGKRRRNGPRDAAIVALLAYAGPRPQELRTLAWADVRERTLLVNANKTGTRRTVRLLAPLAGDLREWRLACGRPRDRAWVFPDEDGEQWTANAFEKWRARVFVPALERASLEHARPYDLRHSFASLLLHEGRSAIYVARQLGHGADLTNSTYGHVIDELEDAPRIAAEDAIKAARGGSDVRTEFGRGE